MDTVTKVIANNTRNIMRIDRKIDFFTSRVISVDQGVMVDREGTIIGPVITPKDMTVSIGDLALVHLVDGSHYLINLYI